MKIEKVNDDKIRIILNIDDLAEKNIDFQSFISSSLESQELFWDMLDTAERECGFVTQDCQLIIEALAVNGGNFILTITKLANEKESSKLRQKSIPRISIRRKSPRLNNDTKIYMFNAFEDFCSFCLFINKRGLQNKLSINSLYCYNNKYFFVFKVKEDNLKFLKYICTILVEFSEDIKYPDLFERKLIEYGKCVLAENAIQTISKHFK
jgi:Negative regulator of genetic competence, sporulation and motility